MLYWYYGNDTERVNRKARALVATLAKKRPDASLSVLEADQLNVLEELIEAQGLFNQRHLVHLRAPFENAVSRELMLGFLPKLAPSENVFIITCGALDAALKKQVERHASESEEFSRPSQPKSQVNSFAMADALQARDKRTLWVAYQEAERAGKVTEEIHGMLFFAVKSMLLASKSTTPEEAGLAPFNYSKGRAGAGRYTVQELELLAQRLVEIYHEAHEGSGDLRTLLELWLLRV